jgi:hypothetical protein
VPASANMQRVQQQSARAQTAGVSRTQLPPPPR